MPAATIDFIDLSRRYESISFHYRVTAGTATIKLQNSINGGATWHDVDSSTIVFSGTGDELLMVNKPVGLYRGYHTACSSATTFVEYLCGAGVGGRP